MEYPGPYLESVGVSNKQISDRALPKIEKLTNGAILELFSFTKQRNWTLNEFVQALEQLNDKFSGVKVSSISTRVNKISAQKKSICHRKKVKGVKNLEDLLGREFLPPLSQKKSDENGDLCEQKNVIQPSPLGSVNVDLECQGKLCNNEHTYQSVCVQTENSNCDEQCITKKWNLKKYLCNKQTRKLRKLNKKIIESQQKLETTQSKIGHYSVKNINKRDETARKNLHLLRDCQRKVQSQYREIKLLSSKINSCKQQIREIKHHEMSLNKIIEDLQEHNAILKEKYQVEKDKKVLLQKSSSYLKKEITVLRENVKMNKMYSLEIDTPEHETCDQKQKQLQLIIDEQDILINELREEIEGKNHIDTKKADGTYNEKIRLCVIELYI